MIHRTPRWSIKVTHTPTGIAVTRTSEHFRNQHQARDSAVKYIKAKLYQMNYTGYPDKEISVTDIPDNEDPWQCDINKYRVIIDETYTGR